MKSLFVAVACLLFLQNVATDDDKKAKCLSCEAEINNVLGIVTSFVKGQEPICLEDIVICEAVNITNVHKMGLVTGTTCLTNTAEKNVFIQKFTIKLEVVNIICAVKDPQGLMDLANKDAGKMMGPLGGASTAALTKLNIIGKWLNLELALTIKIDMVNEKHEVLKAVASDPFFKGLHLSCDGESVSGAMCDLVTKPECVKRSYGTVIGKFAKDKMCDAIKSPEVSAQLGQLTCAEFEYDE